jgi:hypothetical protein
MKMFPTAKNTYTCLLLEILFIWLLILLIHASVIGKPLIQKSDAFNVYCINRYRSAESLKSLEYPVWDSHRYGGVPWSAGLGVISLWTLPYFFFSIDPAGTIVNYLQIFFLMWGFCRLLRGSGISVIVSCVFSALFVCTGPIIFFYGYSPVMNGFITFIWSLVALHGYDRKKNPKYLFAFFVLTTMHFLDMSYHHSVAFCAYVFFDRLVYGRHSQGVKDGVVLPFLVFFLGFMTAALNWIPLLKLIIDTKRTDVHYNDTFLFGPLQFLTGTLWGWAKGNLKYDPLYLYLNGILILMFVPNIFRKYRHSRDLRFYGLVSAVVLLHLTPGYFLGFLFPFLTIYDPFRFNLLLSIILSVNAAKLTHRIISEPEDTRRLSAAMMACIIALTAMNKYFN